jgi:hypothetical protein
MADRAGRQRHRPLCILSIDRNGNHIRRELTEEVTSDGRPVYRTTIDKLASEIRPTPQLSRDQWTALREKYSGSRVDRGGTSGPQPGQQAVAAAAPIAAVAAHTASAATDMYGGYKTSDGHLGSPPSPPYPHPAPNATEPQAAKRQRIRQHDKPAGA